MVSSSLPSTLPATMKAIQVHEYITFDDAGDGGNSLDKAMAMSDTVPVPVPEKDELLIQVFACSISPGDVVMVKGQMIFLAPPSGFPFVPGMDVTGRIVAKNDNDDDDDGFVVGDMVVASNGTLPLGGMAEYMCVKKLEAVKKPTSVPSIKAAASSSAITARNAVLDYVRKGDRVLVLGGSGGVGSAALQLCKRIAGASFVATTSTQKDLCKSLGADDVADYRKENWWELDRWDGQKFDKIIDTVGGGNFTDRATRVLKSYNNGGYFVAVAGDDPKPDCRTWWKAIKFFSGLLGRPLYTWLHKSSLPGYTLLMPYDVPKGRQEVLTWMDNGEVQVKIDESSPLPFTAEGVRRAYARVASGHSHGKVVVSIVDEDVNCSDNRNITQK